MKKIPSGKTTLKVLGLVFMSLFGFLNCIALYKIGKKANSRMLTIFGIGALSLSISAIAIMCLVSADSSLFDIALLCIMISSLLPTVLALVNIGKYQNACSIIELIEKYNINVASLDLNTTPSTLPQWATPSLVATANKMYPGKGYALINDICNADKAKTHPDDSMVITPKTGQQGMPLIEFEQHPAEKKVSEEIGPQNQIHDEKKTSAEHKSILVEGAHQATAPHQPNDSAFPKSENRQRVCQKCGELLLEGKPFCIFCGTKN